MGQLSRDFFLDVVRGNIPGHSALRKFGEYAVLNSADGFRAVTDLGAVYVPPTQARIHDIVSDNAVDSGSVVSSGAATSGTKTTLVDTAATFVSDGVAVGDLILNDSALQVGVVTEVTSETIITHAVMRDPSYDRFGNDFKEDENYRIINNDNATGANVIYIFGLDSDFLEITEFVVLSGLTPVPTTKSYIRQYRARVFSANTAGAVGVVKSTAQTDGTITLQIVDGNNQTLMSVYTVPANKTAYVYRLWGALSKKQAAAVSMRFRSGKLDGVNYVQHSEAISSTGNSTMNNRWVMPQMVIGGLDLWMEADTDTNSTGVSAGFDVVLVENGAEFQGR